MAREIVFVDFMPSEISCKGTEPRWAAQKLRFGKRKQEESHVDFFLSFFLCQDVKGDKILASVYDGELPERPRRIKVGTAKRKAALQSTILRKCSRVSILNASTTRQNTKLFTATPEETRSVFLLG